MWVGEGGILDYVHGSYENWCQKCVTEAQENHNPMSYREIYEMLKKMIRKDYGKRCEDFNFNCHQCQAYLMLDLLWDMVELDEWEGEPNIIGRMGAVTEKRKLINEKEFVKNAKKVKKSFEEEEKYRFEEEEKYRAVTEKRRIMREKKKYKKINDLVEKSFDEAVTEARRKK